MNNVKDLQHVEKTLQALKQYFPEPGTLQYCVMGECVECGGKTRYSSYDYCEDCIRKMVHKSLMIVRAVIDEEQIKNCIGEDRKRAF